MGSIEGANAALVHEYLSWMRDTRDRAPSSVYDYGSRLQRFLTALGPTPLAALTPEQIEEWLGSPRARTGGRKASPATRAKELAIVRSLFRYLCARRHVEHDPSLLVHGPKVRNVHPKPIRPELWAAVWSHPSLDDEARVVLGLRFFVGLSVRLTAGRPPYC
jgi:site-specific recombinase XerD